MSVKVGSARSDEHGKAHGGQAGDQTGREVSTQKWYLHSKGWRVIRPKSSTVAAAIAQSMQWACDNSDIGYDQYQRDTLRLNVEPFGYDIRKTTKPVETDCSALVRTCVAYAFGEDIVAKPLGSHRFSTANMCEVLIATGHFVEMIGSKYQDQPDYLCRGDILCTKKQGHTVVVLNDGDKAENGTHTGDIAHPTIRKGSEGEAVREAQTILLGAGYKLPRYGADGDFGKETESAVKAYQADKNLEVDGIVGKKTWAALTNDKG